MLYVKKLLERAILPKKGSQLAAGYDLFSVEQTVVPAKGKQVVKTGIAIVLPQGTYGRIAPRSGLAAKNFIDVGAGVIDEDYRGEVCVLLFNFGQEDFKVNYGDRIAQLIVEYVVKTEIIETQDLNETLRGTGGFGSTGVQLEQPKQQTNSNEKLQEEQVKQPNEQKKDEEIWQELTVLNLVGLFQNGLITQEQQEHFGKRVLKGDRKIYEVFKKNEGKNQQIISQQLLNIIEE